MADLETFECVACCGTYTGDGWSDAQKLGWRKHEYGKTHVMSKAAGSVAMCGDCTERFAKRREVNAQFNAVIAGFSETDAGLTDAA